MNGDLIRRGDLLEPDAKSDKLLILGGRRQVGKTLEMAEMLMRRKIKSVPAVNAVEVPPVKIGDTAFFVIQRKVYEAKIVLLQWCQRANRVDTEIRGEVIKYHSVSATFSDWGKTVFATKEEAEKVLYPCNHCFCGTYRSCEGCSYGERKDND